MAFTVDDVRISDVTSVQRGTGTDRLERATPIADVLAVDSIPSRLSWSIRIGYSSDAPSRVLCTASVLDPAGHSIVTGLLLIEGSPTQTFAMDYRRRSWRRSIDARQAWRSTSATDRTRGAPLRHRRWI